MLSDKRSVVFLVLSGIFITNALVAEMIGGKLIQVAGITLSLGILPWPIVFLTTDLINEYFGKDGVRKITLLTASLILYVFIVLYLGVQIQAVSFSPVSDEAFQQVFGQSMWIIFGSIIAFLTSQLLDVVVFTFFKSKTQDKHIWLRATGSTIISQLIDSFIVLAIGFYLPGKITLAEFWQIGISGYTCKLIIAILLTPLIYAGHFLIHAYLDDKKM